MRLLVLLVLSAVTLAACGSGEDEPKPKPVAQQAGGDERVIRAWSDDLRRGDEAAAAARFALPAVVANGTPPVRLTTREQVRAFQDSLPCGAVLTGTERHHGLTLARFRLTERPGGYCGSGTGGFAFAAFEIEDGRIVRWLRVDAPEAPASPGPLV